MITSLDSKPNEVLEPDGNGEGLVVCYDCVNFACL